MCDSDSQVTSSSIWGWRGTTAGIGQRIRYLLDTKEQSDVQFAVGQQHGEDEMFQAHKFILSISSDVFYTMFYGSVPNAEKTIRLLDIHPHAFAIMLKYMYTDVVDGLTLENAMATLYCAKKYGIPPLVGICAEYAIRNVDKPTCFAVLEAAKDLGAEDVVQKCLEIVDANCCELFHSDGFLQVKSKTLRLIFARDTLIVKEEDVYNAAQRWAVSTCKQLHSEPTVTNQRYILGETLNFIRFPLMSDALLADGPFDTGLLLKDELLKIYQFKHGSKKPEIPYSAIPRSKPTITFCDRRWTILDQSSESSGKIALGNTFLDDQGHLHLRLSQHNGIWKGAGIQSADAFGYGCYEFRIEARLDQLDSNTVFAMCSQAENQPGLGVQFGKLGNRENPQARYAVCRRSSLLPFVAGIDSSHSFCSPMDGTYSTHFFTYVIKPDGIWFGFRHERQHGTHTGWEEWWYESASLGHMLPVFVSLTDYLGDGPRDGRDVEIVVQSFRFYAD